MRLSWSISLAPVLVAPYSLALSHHTPTSSSFVMKRSQFFHRASLAAIASTVFFSFGNGKNEALAFSSPIPANNNEAAKIASTASASTTPSSINGFGKAVAYRSLSVDMKGFGVNVPVAMWYPAETVPSSSGSDTAEAEGGVSSSSGASSVGGAEGLGVGSAGRGSLITAFAPSVASAATTTTTTGGGVTYSHRISVKKIGQLLAGWDFIPEFVSRNYDLKPTMNNKNDHRAAEGGAATAAAKAAVALGDQMEMGDFVVNGENVELPRRGPLVLLAHGYLGSRFDLSHLAEELARQGFICVSPEYPESLASSYPSQDGLDRAQITSRVLDVINTDLDISPTSYGIVGHSLGCGTAMRTGDESWTRVLIAGFPRQDASNAVGEQSPILFLSSVNDGAVSLSRIQANIPSDYVVLNEADVVGGNASDQKRFPRRAALIFDRPDAPNHISFLASGVNDAMIDLLSPLLPVAQALSIPVLDFDKYKVSRDSKETADVVIPLVQDYLRQNMI